MIELLHFLFRSQDLVNCPPYCLPYMTVTWRIWYWINQLILPDRYFSLFSSLACLILQWYCKDKIFLGHSWEKDPLVLCLQYRDDGDLWIDKYFIDWTTEATNRLNHLSSINLSVALFGSGELLMSTGTSSSSPSPTAVSASTVSAWTQPSPPPSLSSSPSRKIHKLVCTLSTVILVLVIVIFWIFVVNNCHCYFLCIRQMNMSLNLTE